MDAKQTREDVEGGEFNFHRCKAAGVTEDLAAWKDFYKARLEKATARAEVLEGNLSELYNIFMDLLDAYDSALNKLAGYESTKRTNEMYIEVLRDFASSACCQTDGCGLEDPMCDTMQARTVLWETAVPIEDKDEVT
jgi:hypothetical protein